MRDLLWPPALREVTCVLGESLPGFCDFRFDVERGLPNDGARPAVGVRKQALHTADGPTSFELFRPWKLDQGVVTTARNPASPDRQADSENYREAEPFGRSASCSLIPNVMSPNPIGSGPEIPPK